MGRSYLGYQENISTGLLSEISPCYEIITFIYDTKSFPGYRDLALADRRDLVDRDNFCLICAQLFRPAGKPSVCTLQNLRDSEKLYPASGKTFSI